MFEQDDERDDDPRGPIAKTLAFLWVSFGLLVLVVGVVGVGWLVYDLFVASDEPAPTEVVPPTGPEPASIRKTSRGVQVTAHEGEYRLSVTIPRRPAAGQPFALFLDGDTGPIDSPVLPIVITQVYVTAGICPLTDPQSDGSGALDNVIELVASGAGPFRSGARPLAPSAPGAYRLCAYSSDPQAPSSDPTRTLRFEHAFQVDGAPAGAPSTLDEPTVDPGRYVADATDVTGGRPGARVELQVADRGGDVVVQRVRATGLRPNHCGALAQRPAASDDTVDVSGGENDVIISDLSVSFEGAGTVRTQVDGGAPRSDQVRGVLTHHFGGGCSARLVFSARRR